VQVELELERLPRETLVVIVGAVCSKGFERATPSRMELEVRGLMLDANHHKVSLLCAQSLTPRSECSSATQPAQATATRDASQLLRKRFGRRTIDALSGSAYSVAALVRFGAWWHMYPLRACSPGAVDKDGLRRAWEVRLRHLVQPRCGGVSARPPARSASACGPD